MLYYCQFYNIIVDNFVLNISSNLFLVEFYSCHVFWEVPAEDDLVREGGKRKEEENSHQEEVRTRGYTLETAWDASET